MKRIVLCADDYGQNSAISQAIIELAKRSRLTATSCLVTNAEWAQHATTLTPLLDTIDVGLHFNLTEGKLLTMDAPSDKNALEKLLLQATLRKLNKAAIAMELRAQLDVFMKSFNRPPAFLDGHQHVHQLPVIRDALFEVYEERLRAYGTPVRCTYSRGTLLHTANPSYFKRLIIQLCGGIGFHKALVAHQIPHNTSFAGIYDFKRADNYADYFPRFLTVCQDGGIIMCHPGLMGHNNDPILAARHYEYSYFSGQGFFQDVANHSVKLVRMSEALQKR